MGAFNGLFGQTVMRSFPSGHKANSQAIQMVSVLGETNLHYQEFMALQTNVMVEFKKFYTRFEALAKGLQIRDKALAKFKHYYLKLEKLRKDNGKE